MSAPSFFELNYDGKNLIPRYYIDLIERKPKIQTASESGNFPRSYGRFCYRSGLKFSAASYLDLGISLSPESHRHTRMACLEQYQEMERIANFYGTLVLIRGECVDSEYVNINPINETSIEIFTIKHQSELKFYALQD